MMDGHATRERELHRQEMSATQTTLRPDILDTNLKELICMCVSASPAPPKNRDRVATSGTDNKGLADSTFGRHGEIIKGISTKQNRYSVRMHAMAFIRSGVAPLLSPRRHAQT